MTHPGVGYSYPKPYEPHAIEVEVQHTSFEGKATGTVLIAEGPGLKALAAILDSCGGLTIDQIEHYRVKAQRSGAI